jgi:hypothetical protein
MNKCVHLPLVFARFFLFVQFGKLSVINPTIRVYSDSFAQNEVKTSIPMNDYYDQENQVNDTNKKWIPRAGLYLKSRLK